MDGSIIEDQRVIDEIREANIALFKAAADKLKAKIDIIPSETTRTNALFHLDIAKDVVLKGDAIGKEKLFKNSMDRLSYAVKECKKKDLKTAVAEVRNFGFNAMQSRKIQSSQWRNIGILAMVAGSMYGLTHLKSYDKNESSPTPVEQKVSTQIEQPQAEAFKTSELQK